MVRLRQYAWLYIFLSLGLSSHAQFFKTAVSKVYSVKGDTLLLDSLSLVQGSLQLKCYPALDSLQMPSVLYNKHALLFKNIKPDSIWVQYLRYPINFEKRYYHKSPDILYSDMTRRGNPYNIQFNQKSSQENLFLNDGLSKNGNISRGISFGNTQDVVVNSNLNLQVNGKLTPDIDMVMAATDNNIPFQADGTTA
ncbi:MAG: hypothetical protein WCR21_09795, partial [Bacteroidota bacterium]